MDIDETPSQHEPNNASHTNTPDPHTAQETEGTSSTANAILNILQQISISPPKMSDAVTGYRPSLQHLHSLPKSIIPKRRLSSSSSFDGFSTTSGNGNGGGHGTSSLSNIDKTHKKQLVYLRGPNKIPTVRYIPSPLSRSFLIKRLNTFSVFNWTISSNKLSPLVCATQGWKCHPVRKNELHCTSCHSGMIVKLPELKDCDLNSQVDTAKSNRSKLVFNNHHHDDHYYDELFLKNTDKYELQYEFRFLDDELDEDEDDNDDVHVYETLVNSYVKRLSTDHYPTCTFLPILPLTPKDESYYISSKDIPREVIKFKERLAILIEQKDRLIGKNFRRICLTTDESAFLLEYLRGAASAAVSNTIEIDVETEETDFASDLTINPSLDVILPALFGWELKIQKFHNEKFLLLKCECCTRRILLCTLHTPIEQIHNVEELQACPHRAEIPAQEQRTEFDETIGCRSRNGGRVEDNQLHHNYDYDYGYNYDYDYDFEDDEDDDTTDLAAEHDGWCCMRQGWRIVLEGLRSSVDGIPLHSPVQSPALSAQAAIETLRRM